MLNGLPTVWRLCWKRKTHQMRGGLPHTAGLSDDAEGGALGGGAVDAIGLLVAALLHDWLLR